MTPALWFLLGAASALYVVCGTWLAKGFPVSDEGRKLTSAQRIVPMGALFIAWPILIAGALWRSRREIISHYLRP